MIHIKYVRNCLEILSMSKKNMKPESFIPVIFTDHLRVIGVADYIKIVCEHVLHFKEYFRRI